MGPILLNQTLTNCYDCFSERLCTIAGRAYKQFLNLKLIELEGTTLKWQPSSKRTFYEKLAEATATARNDALVVTRQRTDPAILGYIRAVAQTTLESFNSRLYGTVATICNVAFGSDDLTGERIRELIRG